jgi:hypothetical protein
MAKELYSKNNSLRKTSKALSISKTALTRIFKENNIEIKSNCTDMKPNFNENFFKKINSEEKAYWLGFLYADGYLDTKRNSLRLELSSKDLDHLILFCKTLNYPVIKIKERVDRNTFWVNINSLKLSQDLQNLDFKSNSLSINHFDIKYHSCFLRGFYDGDGSIYHKGKTSLGTGLILDKDWINTVTSIIPISDIKVRPVAKSKPDGMYRIETYNLKSSLDLCEFLYFNSTIHLDRKYNKYYSRSNIA